MSEVLQANIFFIITSIAVVVVTVLLAIVLFRAMRILKSIQDITDRFKRGSEVLAEDAMAVRSFVTSGVMSTVKKVIADSKEKFTKKTSKRDKKKKMERRRPTFKIADIMPKKKVVSSGKKKAIAAGVGVTAAAALAAGAYFLYGSKNAASNREKVKGIAKKAKGVAVKGLEKAKSMDHEDYERLVEKAASAYGKLKNASQGDLATFVGEMRTHFSELQKAKGKGAKKVKKGRA